MAAKNQPVLKQDRENFTWTISDFSSLNVTELHSDIFLVGGHRWRINLKLPVGNDAAGFLSVALDYVDSETMPDGWLAFYELIFVNQFNSICSFEIREKYLFREPEYVCRYDDFPLPINKLSLEGFLVNDTLVIEAVISTREVTTSETGSNDEDPEAIQVSLSELLSLQSQRQRNQLVEFLDMSVEALCQSESLDTVKSIALEIYKQANDLHEKRVLEDLLLQLPEFKYKVPSLVSTIAIESSKAQMTNDLLKRMNDRNGLQICLEAEIFRLEVEDLKLRSEIQLLSARKAIIEDDWNLEEEIEQLSARKAKIVEHKNATAVDLERVKLDASTEFYELKMQEENVKQAGEKRMRATKELDHLNENWKLFKYNLGW
ncbi:Ubiquitin C-terminal hydrolase 13 [Linum perenne]